MNVDAIALRFQPRLVVSIMLWTTHRLTLQLMPLIAAYLERGWGAAMSMVAALVVQSVRTRIHPEASALFAESVSWLLSRLVIKRLIIHPAQDSTLRQERDVSQCVLVHSITRGSTCLQRMPHRPRTRSASPFRFPVKGDSGRAPLLVYKLLCQ